MSVATLGLVGACGGDKEACDPDAQAGCESGLVCERVQNSEPACFAPVAVRGQVFDLLDETAVAGARIVALDVNGAAVSSVAISDDAGAYDLTIPSTRLEDGSPLAVELTLRADATGYQTFPDGIRQALPIDTATAVDQNDARVVQSALTDIGLLALPADTGTASIYGTVELPVDRTGTLIVATSADGVGYAGIANIDGEYRIFNLPAGNYNVTAYTRGVNYQPAEVDVVADGEAEVNLALDSTPAGSVTGEVQIVNGGDADVTSVVLAVESTFNELWGRGQTVPGLRAPEPGLAPDVKGAYQIDGVPAGRYVVLAAFENDLLVRDPDLSIAGTATLHIEVAAGAATAVDGFKVTGALEIFGPGAGDPELVSPPVTFRWQDDSSEDEYVVEVFDAFGELIWESSIPGVSGQDPTLEYAGPELTPGMYYQFRVTSMKAGTPISRSEDLKGVFYLQ